MLVLLNVNPVNSMSVDLNKIGQQEGPDVPDLEEFIKVSHDNLLSSGYLVPAFAFHTDGKLNIAMIDENFLKKKLNLSEALEQLIDKYKPSDYWFISEAWAAAGDTAEEGTENQSVTDLPRNQREEVVMITLTDCRNEQPQRWAGMYKIIRDRQGEIHNFSPTRWIKEDKENGLKGNFVL